MREHKRRTTPSQSVVFEMQARDRRRHERKRIERAEEIVDESGFDEFSRADRPARLGSGLVDGDTPTAVGEDIRGNEAVRSRTDHDGVGHRMLSVLVVTGMGRSDRRNSSVDGIVDARVTFDLEGRVLNPESVREHRLQRCCALLRVVQAERSGEHDVGRQRRRLRSERPDMHVVHRFDAGFVRQR